MAAFNKEGPSAIDAILCDTEEEVLGIHVLVDEVHTPLLMGHALAFTPLNEA